MAEKQLSEMEQVELEYKKLQVRKMAQELDEHDEKRARQAADRERQVADFKRSERERTSRQTRCKHRKGGRDNKFGMGTDANYSVNMNTYPDGRMVLSCTRCGMEVARPDQKLMKTNPAEYKAHFALWKEWVNFPTDNSPSGSKIFEIVKDAA